MPAAAIPLPDAARTALERLGSTTLRDRSMESVLQTVVDLVADVLPGRPDSSLTLVVRGRPSTLASSGELATVLDGSQYAQGRGPCLHAATTGELTEVADVRQERRWPDHRRTALGHGCLSSLSVPMAVDDRVSGALNVYAREPHAFDDTARAVARRFVPYAAAAVGTMLTHQDARDMADDLQRDLESRAVLDQARGLLMERYTLTADQASRALARVSMRSNTEVRDVADRLVRTGEFDVRRLRS